MHADLHVGLGGRDVDRRGSGRLDQQRTAVQATAPAPDVALGRLLHGPSEIAAFVEEATRASSDFRFEQVSLFTAGGDYATEWIMIGTNDREVQGVPATGRSFRVRGASVGKLDTSGRIVENRVYYNQVEMFAQLGLQPAAPPRPA
jgi:steroid delta-isomerase-like uncharacterized protein